MNQSRYFLLSNGVVFIHVADVSQSSNAINIMGVYLFVTVDIDISLRRLLTSVFDRYIYMNQIPQKYMINICRWSFCISIRNG